MTPDGRPDPSDRFIDAGMHLARYLPRGRTTAYRLLRLMTGQPEFVLGTVDGQRFCVDTTDTDIAENIYLYDAWEPTASALWVSMLRPGMCVVDVGANKGYFSLLAAKRSLPGGRVISYEPAPRNSPDIERTCRANNYSHWQVRACAVSSVPGVATLYQPGVESGSGWGSLQTPRNGAPAVTTQVPLVTLADDLRALQVAGVDLLKMDIEGHEVEALTGALPLLRDQMIRRLQVEVHAGTLGQEKTRGLFGMMAELGYGARILDETTLSATAAREIVLGRATFPEGLLTPLSPAEVTPERVGRWFKVLWEADD